MRVCVLLGDKSHVHVTNATDTACNASQSVAPSLPSAKPDMRGSASSAGMPVAHPKHCCSQVADSGRYRRSFKSYLHGNQPCSVIYFVVSWQRST
jgi:hypothetical protein